VVYLVSHESSGPGGRRKTGENLRQFRNYLGLTKDREVWFSLGENHDMSFRFGLQQLRNCPGRKVVTNLGVLSLKRAISRFSFIRNSACPQVAKFP
jgi:hypothetical protein